ncbi:hypothetical protein PS687_03174 [Pseudomonas fluorescens]|nr:hypothetical protein PS687_03174 [Pseudomonas fluorescens]
MPIDDTSPAAQQQLKALAPAVLDTCPNMQTMAAETAREILVKHDLAALDPDRVYWHRFKAGTSDSQAFTGWVHNEKPLESMTLSQLVIHRFSLHDQDNADLLDGDGGFYSVGPDAQVFDHRNEVRLSASDVLGDFWDINFSERYSTRVDGFWSAHQDDFRTLGKVNFLAQALQARQANHLTDAQFQTVIKAVASNISWPPSLANLQAEAPAPQGLRLAALDIGGHIASDILRIIDRDGRQIIYVPGEAQAFHCFNTPADLHFWLLCQTNHPQNRARFMTHFPLSAQVQQDDTDAVSWRQLLVTPVLIYRTAQALTGTLPPDWVDKGLNAQIDQLFVTWGAWNHHLINQADLSIDGDAFTWLAQSSKARMNNDADFCLHSNGDLRKKLWIGYLNAFGKIFGPMAVVGGPVALVVIGASVANLGLNIDQAVNGKTPAERRAGEQGAVFSAIDTLFNLTLLKVDGVLPDIAEASESFAEASEQTTRLPEPVDTPEVSAESVAPAPLLPSEVPAHYESNLILEGETCSTTPGKYFQVYTLKTSDNLPQQAILMNDRAYYIRYENDPNGPGYWAIVDPANPNAFSGSLPVRLNELNEWEPLSGRLGLKGGGGNSSKAGKASKIRPTPEAPRVTPQAVAKPEPSSAVRRVTTVFDTPPSLRPELRKWALGLIETHIQGRFLNVDRYTHYFGATQNKLVQSAKDFYRELSWPRLPERPGIPTVAPSTTFSELLERLPEDLPGLVIGETPDRITSTRLIMENMPQLARKGVKTLYLQRLLNDFVQDDLNHFFQTGSMSEDLETSLNRMSTDPTGQFNELELIKTARNNGIRVQALDCAAHTKYPDPMLNRTEQMTRNYLGHTVFRADRTLNDGGKWLFMTSPTSTNTFREVAGISELEGGIGIRVEEVYPGQGHDLRIDPGIEVDHDVIEPQGGPANTFDTLHADLRLQVEAPPLQRTVLQNQRLLFRKGMYLIDESQGSYTLYHHSRGQGVVMTPITRSAEGSFIIDRPTWPLVHQVHFPTLDGLSRALNNTGLSMQSRLPRLGV